MEEVIRYRKQDLLDYAIKFMGKLGVPKQDAKIVGDVLIAADLRGVNSHGLIRLSSYYGNRLLKKYMDPKTPWKVVKETDTTMLIDGGNGVGQVVSYHAMNKCLEKAKKANVAVVTVKHSNHYGIAGYYAMMALDYGMIGISLTNSQPLTAPTYGSTAVFGTNPIAVAAPSDNQRPFVLDMATSTVPIGRVKVYEKKGEKIPLGWGIDDNGNLTDDPRKVQSGGPGAVTPLGGSDIMRSYKGYGLAIMVDILCGALSGAANLTHVGFPHEPRESDVSHFFMAINIESFRPLIDFKKQMDTLIEELKQSPKAQGQDRIFVAGEKEFENEEYNQKHGIPLLVNVVRDLEKNGQKIGVPFNLKPVS
ncbi:MAG: Ldh family oxidoreductase [Actinomycetota bacterium]|nr:Ldh family oxidoreductase [Actinomycetota bacterium]